MKRSDQFLLFFILVIFAHNTHCYSESLEEIRAAVFELTSSIKVVQKKIQDSQNKLLSIKKNISTQKGEINKLEKELGSFEEAENSLQVTIQITTVKLSKEKEILKKFLSSGLFASETETNFIALAHALHASKKQNSFEVLSALETETFYEVVIERRRIVLDDIIKSQENITRLQKELDLLRKDNESKKKRLQETLDKNAALKKEAEEELQKLSEKKLELSSMQGALRAKELRLTVAQNGIIEAPTALVETKKSTLGEMNPPNIGFIIREFNAPRVKKSAVTRIAGVDFVARDSIVTAAASGKVRFVGVLSDFDSVVIIEHPDRVYSFYAPVDGIKVKTGQEVPQGTVIGSVRKDENLYFEVRKGQVPVNPREFIR